MKIYEVIPNFLGGSSHVTIAKNKSAAIEITVNYLNSLQTHDIYKTSEFTASEIEADKFSGPTVIV